MCVSECNMFVTYVLHDVYLLRRLKLPAAGSCLEADLLLGMVYHITIIIHCWFTMGLPVISGFIMVYHSLFMGFLFHLLYHDCCPQSISILRRKPWNCRAGALRFRPLHSPMWFCVVYWISIVIFLPPWTHNIPLWAFTLSVTTALWGCDQ